MQETNNQQIKIIEAWLGVGLVVVLVALFLFLTKGRRWICGRGEGGGYIYHY
jgi:hypothetical protein